MQERSLSAWLPAVTMERWHASIVMPPPNGSRLSCGAKLESSQRECYHTACQMAPHSMTTGAGSFKRLLGATPTHDSHGQPQDGDQPNPGDCAYRSRTKRNGSFLVTLRKEANHECHEGTADQPCEPGTYVELKMIVGIGIHRTHSLKNERSGEEDRQRDDWCLHQPSTGPPAATPTIARITLTATKYNAKRYDECAASRRVGRTFRSRAVMVINGVCA
jgi:hypothetical protein